MPNLELGTMQQDSGSIGIGAMIVFIALILVAAVASTVIIRSAEDLSVKTEQSRDDRAFSKVEIADIQIFNYEPCWQLSVASEDDCIDGSNPHQAGHYELVMMFSVSGEQDLVSSEVHYQVSCSETKTSFLIPSRTASFGDSQTWDSLSSQDSGLHASAFNRGSVVLPGETMDNAANAIETLEPNVPYSVMIDLYDNQNSFDESDDEGCRISRDFTIQLTVFVEGGMDTFAIIDCDNYLLGTSCY
tara:strand:- start:123 stop:857 length:735 start_codon:yes stop_codon:yes gene_type:complete